MSITNHSDAAAYTDALNGKAGARAKLVASATDRLMGELVAGYEEAGLKFPGDDRCYNLEVAIFKVAMEANQT